MSNCQVPMPTYERPEPVGELVDSLKRENDALKEAVSGVLRCATDTVWVGDVETLVDRMVSIGVYGEEVYDGARPWEEK